ncbi:rlmN [Acrasis kona]|uniref:RlmN n=1 Tax=Acrasis kona TaxID=1008807 RepID=A0AAW2YSZ8_9EUKA
MEAQDKEHAAENFRLRAQTVASSIDSNMRTSISNFLTLHSMLSLFGSVSYYDKFLPFTTGLFADTNGVLPKFMIFLVNLDIVKDSELPAYKNKLQNWGGMYRNFNNVTRYDPEGKVVNDIVRDEYYLVSQVLPSGVPGSNFGSEKYLNETIQQAIRTNTDVVSSRLPLVAEGPIYFGVVLFKPVTFEGKVISVLTAGFDTLALIQASSPLLPNEGVAIYDGTGAYLGSVTNRYCGGSDFNEAQIENAIKDAKIVDYTHNVTLRNTSWKVVFFSCHLAQSDDKVIPLVACLLSGIFAQIVLVLIYGYRKIIIATRAQQLTRQRVEVLEVHRFKLASLLKKSVRSEEKSRGIINSIPDLVIVINDKGKMMQCNNSFDNYFAYTEKEWKEGIYIQSILVDLQSEFYSSMQPSVSINTNALLRDGQKMNVDVKVASMGDKTEEETGTPNSPAPSTKFILEEQQVEEEEAFVILMRTSESSHRQSATMPTIVSIQ